MQETKKGVMPVLRSSEVRRIEPISVEEIHKAQKEVLKCVQRQSFEEEISCLDDKGGEIDGIGSRSNLVKKLQIKMPSSIYKLDPIAPTTNAAKHQLILPKKHHVVKLIVCYFHLKSGHSGLEHVLSLIRERFWIPKARMAVNIVLNDCFDCKRRQGPLGQQKMAARLTPGKPPFTFVGVEYFGPFEVRMGRSLGKRYGDLFSCLPTTAIHLEVAHNLDTDSFINTM